MFCFGDQFSDIYAGFFRSLESAQTRFITFYECAAQEGYCKQLSIYLVGEQTKNMLPTIINIDYLNKYNITLSEAVVEYYKLLLYQILDEKYLAIMKQKHIYSFIDELVGVLENVLLIK